jgi:hypothetical protein
MKPIKLTESEKENILRLHNSNILIEQSTGKTIADIQKLVGANPDNKLGPQTLAAIKAKLGQPDKSTTPTVDGFTYEQLKGVGWTDDQIAKTKYKSLIPTTTPTVDGFTYEQLKGVGWTDDQIAKTKYKSLIPTTTTTMKTTDTKTPETIGMERMKVGSLTKSPTTSGLQVGVERTGGTEDVKTAQVADKSGEKPKADDAVDSRNV